MNENEEKGTGKGGISDGVSVAGIQLCAEGTDSAKGVVQTENLPRGRRNPRVIMVACATLLFLAVVFVCVAAVSGLFSGRRGGETAPDSIKAPDSLMRPRSHGTCVAEPQRNLRWKVDEEVADRISCFNRHYAEYRGYWVETDFLRSEKGGQITFYDSITGKQLFIAPRGRSFDDFVDESRAHGWPSFRDEEVVTENVRVLPNGETVSVDGTHLGHNLPDSIGNRYCINIVCIAGNPVIEQEVGVTMP